MINLTNVVFYKKFKGIVSINDYVDWSIYMINRGEDNYILNILCSFKPYDNIHEADEYFVKACNLLSINEPNFDCALREYIKLLVFQAEVNTASFDNIFKIFDEVSQLNDFKEDEYRISDKYSDWSVLIHLINEYDPNKDNSQLFNLFKVMKDNIIKNGI